MSVAMQAYAKQQYGEQTYTSLQSILDDPTNLLISTGSSFHRPVGADLDILSASQYPQGLMQPYSGVDRISRKRKATSSDQLYGGIVVTDAATNSTRLSSHEPSPQPAEKKKKPTKRVSVNDADDLADSKKQRGRPRLDPRDQTAADRRRTQIRLAQRAYRHRKETTIAGLKQQVTTLQTTIDQMNKTFLALHDSMVDAGILTSHYSLARQLRVATEQFVALSKDAVPESDEEEDKPADFTQGESKQSPRLGENNKRTSVTSARKSSASSSQSCSPARAEVESVSSLDELSFNASAAVEDLPLAGNNDTTTDQAEGSGSTDNSKALLDLSQSWYTDIKFDQQGLDDGNGFGAMPAPFLVDNVFDKIEVERPLVPSYHQGSYTYSFQETTFARRLHRMSLERGFRNLAQPHIDPEYLKHAFRFAFCYSNRKRMLERFQERLKRRAGESLENFNVPFFHIGGAGTHFPRRDNNGNPIYPPNLVHPAQAFGPQPYMQPETPRTEKSTQEVLDNIGFGGQWYDSHDVEEYLKTKGIYLDGQSSFVPVDPAVLRLVQRETAVRDSITSASASASASAFSLSSHSSSPHDASIRAPSPPMAGGLGGSLMDPVIAGDFGNMYSQPGPGSLFPNPFTTEPHSGTPSHHGGTIGNANDVQVVNIGNSSSSNSASPSSNPWDEFSAQTSSSLFQDMQHQHQQNLLGPSQYPAPVIFDVELFLERMIQGGACLGRAPGYRKEAVDAALVLSLQGSF
ncbi:hypothetical protein A1O1_04217 [Capronia coronata CBS 617.96]|uniref:BZIP domain-containing protein n=1 Tax=Capronia coronata CBS 617.96 TaxID=1182541 RepID=W9YN50_9EURO|nr:uncharacterized protein A1O1_04217 [Capronia coronata CBS 617.96]EXJ91110.1 hypothetical protein A1O1_04217 [Capronia coronata CBS 617.96]